MATDKLSVGQESMLTEAGKESLSLARAGEGKATGGGVDQAGAVLPHAQFYRLLTLLYSGSEHDGVKLTALECSQMYDLLT